jgi:hypothetical protein
MLCMNSLYSLSSLLKLMSVYHFAVIPLLSCNCAEAYQGRKLLIESSSDSICCLYLLSRSTEISVILNFERMLMFDCEMIWESWIIFLCPVSSFTPSCESGKRRLVKLYICVFDNRKELRDESRFTAMFMYQFLIPVFSSYVYEILPSLSCCIFYCRFLHVLIGIAEWLAEHIARTGLC